MWVPGDMLQAARVRLRHNTDSRAHQREPLDTLSVFITFTTVSRFAARLPPGSAPTDANPQAHCLEETTERSTLLQKLLGAALLQLIAACAFNYAGLRSVERVC